MELNWKNNFTPPNKPYIEPVDKDLSYKFYASPDGRKVATRIQGLRRHVLTLYFVVGLVVSVSGILIFSLLKGGW